MEKEMNSQINLEEVVTQGKAAVTSTESSHPLNEKPAPIKPEDMVNLPADATIGQKMRALRKAQNMSLAEFSRRTGLTSRALRYIEDGTRNPSTDAVHRAANALGVVIDYFMDEETYYEQLSNEQFYAEVKKKYGSKGLAQAKKIAEETSALFAGGELSEADQQAFIEEMQEIFMIAKEDAKKFTPKKYLNEHNSAES